MIPFSAARIICVVIFISAALLEILEPFKGKGNSINWNRISAFALGAIGLIVLFTSGS